jgi:hypothetical protein
MNTKTMTTPDLMRKACETGRNKATAEAMVGAWLRGHEPAARVLALHILTH